MPAETGARGRILAIGGREARHGDGAILRRFVECAGGPSARVLVVTTASKKREERTREYRAALETLGVPEVSFLHHATRLEAGAPGGVASLERADAVFFAGGNQLKLVTLLAGTAFERALRGRHREGLLVAGTSAGAAAMSGAMLARGSARSVARLGALRLTPGLGLLPRVIVDQHFRERDRFGRLISAVLCNASLLGFGLDEDTAFELGPDERATVLGRGALTIVDGSALESTDIDVAPEGAAAAFAGLRVHALTAGWSYDLGSGRVERPVEEPESRAQPSGLAADG